MRVAVVSYCGTVGKTTVASHVLAPRMEKAQFFAVESTNETGADLGVENVEQLRGERFAVLLRELLLANSAIVDVGASNAEPFLAKMTAFAESHLEFDYFVVPVVPGAKEQKETVKTIRALSALGVAPEKIRVLFNRLGRDVAEEFPAIMAYAKTSKACVANPEAAIPESEVFDLLNAKRTTIGAVLADATDYRSQLRSLDRAKEAKKVSHACDMHALKSLARTVNVQLDRAYAALFA